MSSDDYTAKMMKLCSLLVGTSPESDSAREECCTQVQRVSLFEGEPYGIPAAQPGDPGHNLAHYERPPNFERAIVDMTDRIKQMLAGKPFQGKEVRDELPGGWKPTNLFEFLWRLTQEPALDQRFRALFPGGSVDEQKQFLAENLPENSYEEREAITALLCDGHEEVLAISVGTIMTTFQREYQFLC